MSAKPELSTRAKNLLERLRQGRFYYPDGKEPKAMQELVDAKLVGTMGRVIVIRRCYVAKGHKPFVIDRAPAERAMR